MTDDDKICLHFLMPLLTELWAKFPELPWTGATNPLYPAWVRKQRVLVLECSHLDLLYLRATQQKTLQAQIWSEPQAAGFVWEQLQLTKQLLIQAQPVVLIIANRLGRLLTGFEQDPVTRVNEWMGLQFSETPDAQGVYRLTGSTTDGRVDGG